MMINKYANYSIPPEGLPPCSECGGKWFLQSTEGENSHWTHDCPKLRDGASVEEILAHIRRRKRGAG